MNTPVLMTRKAESIINDSDISRDAIIVISNFDCFHGLEKTLNCKTATTNGCHSTPWDQTYHPSIQHAKLHLRKPMFNPGPAVAALFTYLPPRHPSYMQRGLPNPMLFPAMPSTSAPLYCRHCKLMAPLLRIPYSCQEMNPVSSLDS